VIVGRHAFLADGEAGLRVVDVSTPTAPREIGSVDTAGYAYDVAAAGTFVYVADGASGLKVVDVQAPSAPREVAGLSLEGGDVRGVHIAGSRAFVAAGSLGLVVVDVSDPKAPREISRSETPRTADAVFVAGNRAYVADTEWLRVYDVSEPSSPVEVGSYETPSYARDLWVAGDTAYLAADQAGLMVFSLGAAPAAPIADAPAPVPTSPPDTEAGMVASLRQAAEQPGAGPQPKIRYARFLLTCEQTALRDPATALDYALAANAATGFKQAIYLDTLSLAYHANGKTSKAIKNQKLALERLPESEVFLRGQLAARLAELEKSLAAER
jgi:hypothetical protein